MAAVTVSFPVFFFLMAVAGGLTMAASILVSQAYGAKDWGHLNRVVHNSFVLTAVVAIAFTVIGHFLAEPLLRVMDTPREVLPMAAQYLRIFLLAMPFMFGGFLLASLLRGTGDSTTPLYFQSVFVVLTAILDPLLMFGWLGFPKLGLNGTAVATIITNGGAFISLLVYLHLKKHILAPNWLHLRVDWATSWLTIRIGIPSMIQQGLVSIGAMVIISLVNAFGKNGAAAYGAALRIDQLAFMPALTLGMAVSTLAGQNIGAREYGRVKEVFKWGIVLSCGITAVCSLLVIAIPGIVLRAFLKDPVVIGIGVHYLRIVGAAYCLFAVMFVANGIINGAGHTFITTLTTFVSIWGVRVPMAAYLAHHTHRIEGIWYGMVLGFAAGMITSVAYYLSGRWKRPISRTMQIAEGPLPEISALPETLAE
jgi:putative MATE family efflux protein